MNARQGATISPTAFTLMEVLLALSIMSVVAVALFSSLSAAFKAKRTAEASLETIREGEAAMELIRAELESALPPRGVLAGAFTGRDWRGANGGDDDDCSFYSSNAAPSTVVSPADIKRMELTVATLEGTGERVLLRRVTSNLLAATRPDPDDEVLCRNVASFDMRYYDGFLWSNTWDSVLSGDVLPVAIEVTLELDPPQSRINTGDYRRPRFNRVVYLPCTGGEELSERDTTGAAGTGEGTGTGTGTGGTQDAGGMPGGGQ